MVERWTEGIGVSPDKLDCGVPQGVVRLEAGTQVYEMYAAKTHCQMEGSSTKQTVPARLKHIRI
jgi:hypothetical protein